MSFFSKSSDYYGRHVTRLDKFIFLLIEKKKIMKWHYTLIGVYNISSEELQKFHILNKSDKNHVSFSSSIRVIVRYFEEKNRKTSYV